MMKISLLMLLSLWTVAAQPTFLRGGVFKDNAHWKRRFGDAKFVPHLRERLSRVLQTSSGKPPVGMAATPSPLATGSTMPTPIAAPASAVISHRRHSPPHRRPHAHHKFSAKLPAVTSTDSVQPDSRATLGRLQFPAVLSEVETVPRRIGNTSGRRGRPAFTRRRLSKALSPPSKLAGRKLVLVKRLRSKSRQSSQPSPIARERQPAESFAKRRGSLPASMPHLPEKLPVIASTDNLPIDSAPGVALLERLQFPAAEPTVASNEDAAAPGPILPVLPAVPGLPTGVSFPGEAINEVTPEVTTFRPSNFDLTSRSLKNLPSSVESDAEVTFPVFNAVPVSDNALESPLFLTVDLIK